MYCSGDHLKDADTNKIKVLANTVDIFIWKKNDVSALLGFKPENEKKIQPQW